jgi:hypothetical protein
MIGPTLSGGGVLMASMSDRRILSPQGARKVIGEDRVAGRVYAQCRADPGSRPTSADYLAIGPVFSTASKVNPDPVVGLEGVRLARALTRKPLVAIGGITCQLQVSHRGGGGLGRGNIRSDSGTAKISRGIFTHLEVK